MTLGSFNSTGSENASREVDVFCSDAYQFNGSDSRSTEVATCLRVSLNI